MELNATKTAAAYELNISVPRYIERIQWSNEILDSGMKAVGRPRFDFEVGKRAILSHFISVDRKDAYSIRKKDQTVRKMMVLHINNAHKIAREYFGYRGSVTSFERLRIYLDIDKLVQKAQIQCQSCLNTEEFIR